jgi:hypothetical protein
LTLSRRRRNPTGAEGPAHCVGVVLGEGVGVGVTIADDAGVGVTPALASEVPVLLQPMSGRHASAARAAQRI